MQYELGYYLGPVTPPCWWSLVELSSRRKYFGGNSDWKASQLERSAFTEIGFAGFDGKEGKIRFWKQDVKKLSIEK